jgi:hypothetical protein
MINSTSTNEAHYFIRRPSDPTVTTKANNWNSAAPVLTIRTVSSSVRFRQYHLLHALCSLLCRSIFPNKPIWNCGLSLWNTQPIYGTICLVQALVWPLRNSTQVTYLSVTTILLACVPSAPYMFSTPASKMDTMSQSGNLGLVAVNFRLQSGALLLYWPYSQYNHR